MSRIQEIRERWEAVATADEIEEMASHAPADIAYLLDALSAQDAAEPQYIPDCPGCQPSLGGQS